MTNTDLQAVIFDLDGTLADSSGDVLACIRESFTQLQYSLEAELSAACIGPPLIEMLRHLAPSLPTTALEELVVRFRKLYAESGFRDTKLYVGVEPLLESLRRHNITCLIATNKPRYLTEDLLNKKNIQSCFQGWMCIGDDGLVSKTALINALLTRHQLTAHRCVVIGDGTGDLEAANTLGIRSIAHLGGYGTAAELLDCKPTFAVEHMHEVQTILTRMTGKHV